MYLSLFDNLKQVALQESLTQNLLYFEERRMPMAINVLTLAVICYIIALLRNEKKLALMIFVMTLVLLFQ